MLRERCRPGFVLLPESGLPALVQQGCTGTVFRGHLEQDNKSP